MDPRTANLQYPAPLSDVLRQLQHNLKLSPASLRRLRELGRHKSGPDAGDRSRSAGEGPSPPNGIDPGERVARILQFLHAAPPFKETCYGTLCTSSSRHHAW